ncbi:MAG: hypothetical protein HC808_10500 [Candidatus Competibacteraceae bacterium]|nr:hypothetical protein [Candidatus Competibacteraceae bacterium]
MTTSHPDIKASLIRASHVAAQLVQDGLRVEEIRIRGRAQPAVQIRPNPNTGALNGRRYAWGRDIQGPFERYAALLDGVQVQWEIRRNQLVRFATLPFREALNDT